MKQKIIAIISSVITFSLLFMLLQCSNPVSETDQADPRDPSDFSPQWVDISEFMVQQENTLKDPDFGLYTGWIELHNHEKHPVDLSEWILALTCPDSGEQYASILPEQTVIEAETFLLVWASGKGVNEQAIHLDFTLPDHGGLLGLYGPQWAGKPVIDTIRYHARDVATDISLGKVYLGSDNNHTGYLLPMNRPSPGEANRLQSLRQIDSFTLDIKDPSGLDLHHSGKHLWTVNDEPGGSIYKITKSGTVIDELKVNGDDMEGISQHPVNRLLYVVEERKREIVQFDTLGNRIQSYRVDVEIQRENDGLEGITIHPVSGHVFVVNKRLPRVLIELDLSRPPGLQKLREIPINFGASPDTRGLSLSGIFFEAEEEVLWLTSDEAEAVFILDLNGRPLAAFDAGIEDPEGIALIREEGLIYLVSDLLQSLFVFEYPRTAGRLSATR